MTLLSLTTKEEAEALALEIFPAHREDIEVDNGRGGYRSATHQEQKGCVIARGDSKSLRQRGVKMPGITCYCKALEQKENG